MVPGNDVIYVHTVSYNFEYPVVFNESKCAYVNVMYALDRNGTLIWQKPVGSRVTLMEAKNGTVYYSTGDGKVNAAKIDAAAGIALLAIAYVVLRFFFIGSVARAKGRLNANENRNAVYDFILENPGSTLYDISRTLGMNIGTVRYHLFILGMNHRIVAYHTGVKYVRYFTNSGSYSRAEQSIISLVRRDVMRKILGLLIEKPGLSNMQIAHALNTPESSVSKYMKELSFEGIVMKCPTGSYSIKAEYQPLISNALEHTGMNS
jgi:predicted transcriptional regulator